MEIILRDNQNHVLRFDKDEEVIGGLIKFSEEEKIYAGVFWGIGAAKEVILSFYKIDEKEYQDHALREKLEIASLTGNISKLLEGDGEKTIIHAHGSFSNSSMQVHGGHVKNLVVSATCEIYLTKIEGKMEREYSEEIGLNLLK